MISLNYRGPLSSCNYGCSYCPFAKTWEEEAVLEADRTGLERFVAWAEAWQGPPLEILFTPWGEALVRRWYRDAMVRLSHAPAVRRVAAQTNLSMKLSWLQEANTDVLALWTTWHPTECSLARFLQKSEELLSLGIRHSVGVVGHKQHFGSIQELAERVRAPLWINAWQREPNYYSAEERLWLLSLDPTFGDNRAHSSIGRGCFAGERHFLVDGDGDLRRCHFIEASIGNLYQGGLQQAAAERVCPNQTCRCHIGYLHLKHLGLYDVYGRGRMERIVEPQASCGVRCACLPPTSRTLRTAR